MTRTRELLNLPNILTLSRIVAVPAVVLLLLFESRENCFWAAVVFTAASVTDWLDGYLARRWGIVTILGKFLDPLADKLIVMAALIMLIPLIAYRPGRFLLFWQGSLLSPESGRLLRPKGSSLRPAIWENTRPSSR